MQKAEVTVVKSEPWQEISSSNPASVKNSFGGFTQR